MCRCLVGRIDCHIIQDFLVDIRMCRVDLRRFLLADTFPNMGTDLFEFLTIDRVILYQAFEVMVTMNQYRKVSTFDTSNMHLPLDLSIIVCRHRVPSRLITTSLDFQDSDSLAILTEFAIERTLTPFAFIAFALDNLELGMFLTELLELDSILKECTPLFIFRRSMFPRVELIVVYRESGAPLRYTHTARRFCCRNTITTPVEPLLCSLL